jgi:abortive infection bacteriophage resistance protein
MRTSVGFFMSRLDRVYDKPPLTIDQMIELMESRNLIVPDKDRARHYLKYINYYRLSGYGYLFEEDHTNGTRSHRFRDGTTFENILSIYDFDRHLRLLVMDAIERIEVGVRTILAYEMSHQTGDGHWVLDAALFKETDDFKHADFIGRMKSETAFAAEEGSDRKNRREPFLTHYFDNYDDPVLPPSWMLIEVLPLGTWSKVYANLQTSKDRKRVARALDLSPATLQSWLHSLTYLRNLCAHHSRIYGRKLMFPPAMRDDWPELPPYAFSRFIAVVEFLLHKMAPETHWGDKVKALIESQPLAKPALMGIEDHDFWECKL